MNAFVLLIVIGLLSSCNQESKALNLKTNNVENIFLFAEVKPQREHLKLCQKYNLKNKIVSEGLIFKEARKNKESFFYLYEVEGIDGEVIVFEVINSMVTNSFFVQMS